MPDDDEDSPEVTDTDTLSIDIDREGVCRALGVARGSLIVVPVEDFERMLTEVFGEGLSRRPMDDLDNDT